MQNTPENPGLNAEEDGQLTFSGLPDPIPTAEENAADTVTELPLALVYGNPAQPRKDFDDASLFELAESIKAHGVFSPILVAEDGKGRYMIIAGERRFRASQIAGKDTIPAIIRKYEKREIAEIALIENLQREDLNPMESAAAIKLLMDEYDLTQEVVAARIGKSRSAVANTLRLLTLSEKVTALVKSGALSQGHARALVSLPKAEQERIAFLSVEKGLSVRETEQKVRDYFHPKEEAIRKKQELRRAALTNELKDMVERMQRVFGTKVSVYGTENKGRFYIDYYTRDDLERLLALVSYLEGMPRP